VIGDSYTHGLMDGEAMHKWRKLATKEVPKILQDYLRYWQTTFTTWEKLNIDLSAWRSETVGKLLLEKLRQHPRLSSNDLLDL